MPWVQLFILLAGVIHAIQEVPATVDAIKKGKASVEAGAQNAILVAGGALLLLLLLTAKK